MKYLSVCSGIEAATVAWHGLGFEPVGFSEIESFPSAVLRHHYPSVPNFGDMNQHEQWSLPSIDLLVGGTPCQSFSVAGLRAGLRDPRGGLMLRFLEIAQRRRPRWIVWENVPGVLSSNGGRDFGTFLGALGELGYGWAYRVLDAQWFGVAQRRRRVFVVGCLGDWRRAAAVLFERESVRRDTAPSREKGQDVAKCLTAGVAKRYNPEHETLPLTHTLRASHDASEDGTGRGTPLIPVPLAQNAQTEHLIISKCITRGEGYRYDFETCTLIPCHYRKSRRAQSVNDHETWLEDRVSNTLNCFDVGESRATDVIAFHPRQDPIYGDVAMPNETKGPMAVMQPIAFKPGQSAAARSLGAQTDIACTLEGGGGGNNKQAVAVPVATGSYWDHPSNPHPTLHSKSDNTCDLPMVQTAMQVRRLTPVECERLQGFPDNYTNIPWRKQPSSPDGPRYKALGNSMAVPVMRWIGRRITENQ